MFLKEVSFAKIWYNGEIVKYF